jgi:hypothetical protein
MPLEVRMFGPFEPSPGKGPGVSWGMASTQLTAAVGVAFAAGVEAAADAADEEPAGVTGLELGDLDSVAFVEPVHPTTETKPNPANRPST